MVKAMIEFAKSDWTKTIVYAKHTENMKTAAFIPIKSNSERVKGKNFLKLCGRKLYEHIIENSISAKCFEDIYVDTDSQEIKDYCNKVE